MNYCLTCDGTGLVCTTCGESEVNCLCDPDDMNVADCEDCAGTGTEQEDL